MADVEAPDIVSHGEMLSANLAVADRHVPSCEGSEACSSCRVKGVKWRASKVVRHLPGRYHGGPRATLPGRYNPLHSNRQIHYPRRVTGTALAARMGSRMATGRRQVTTRAGRAITAVGLLAGVLVCANLGLATGAGDPLRPEQWSLTRISAPLAWVLVPTNSNETLVAIVDTGVDPAHPDLVGRLWKSPPGTPNPSGRGEVPAGSTGWDFIDQDAVPSPVAASAVDAPSPGPFYDHGTKVAGIVGAEVGNGVGTAGVDPHARIMVLRACTSLAAGCLASAPAMDWAASVGARVVNVSVGGLGRSAGEAAAIADHPETLFVVSAGNTGRDVDAPGAGHWPCVDPSPNVVCVANTTRIDALDPTSNYGQTSVDIAAPGTDILSTTVGGGYSLGSGTSDASPQVAGVASLLFSALPTASAAQVKAAILAGARPVPKLAGRLAVAGVVDARGALVALLDPNATSDCAGTAPCATGDPTAQITGAPVDTKTGRPVVASAALTTAKDGSLRLRIRLQTRSLRTSWRLVRTAAPNRAILRGSVEAVPTGSTVQARLVGVAGRLGPLTLIVRNAAGQTSSRVRRR